MATSLLIDEGRAGLDVLEQLWESFPSGYDDDNPADVIASLLWLDAHFGVAQPSDRVVLNPMVGIFLPAIGRVLEPKEAAEFWARLRLSFLDEIPEGVTVLSQEELELQADSLCTWFLFQFDALSADGTPLTLHPILTGRSLWIRFMTDDEAENAGFNSATVRDDGMVIQVPTEQGVTRF